MVNEKKSVAYKKLVEKVLSQYPIYSEKVPDKLGEFWSPVVNGENICREINLWTYWQGLGYAEKTPKIKYLLVGQDWGNIFGEDKIVERITAINAGNKNLPYFDSTKSVTNKNLMELFKVLGYEDILTRNDDLFFTNFCLGYLFSGSDDSKMTKKKMFHDAKLFKELCEILEPENILCLGKFTAECAYETLTGEFLKIENFNDFLANHEEIKIKCGEIFAKFYPLAHPGGMGTMNRNRNLPKQNDTLYYQKKDWARIAKDNK